MAWHRFFEITGRSIEEAIFAFQNQLLELIRELEKETDPELRNGLQEKIDRIQLKLTALKQQLKDGRTKIGDELEIKIFAH